MALSSYMHDRSKTDVAQGNGNSRSEETKQVVSVGDRQRPTFNETKWGTKKLVIVALMCALAILLSFIEFPIFPAASFLKLDVALVPSAVVGFAYGAGPGVLCGIACAAAHAVITGNWVGALMSIIVAIMYIVPSSSIYAHFRTMRGAAVGLVVGVVFLIVGACVANLVIDPIFYGMPFDVVASLILPAIFPFNVIKGVVVSALTIIIYKSISGLITTQSDRVKA